MSVGFLYTFLNPKALPPPYYDFGIRWLLSLVLRYQSIKINKLLLLLFAKQKKHGGDAECSRTAILVFKKNREKSS